MSYFIMTRIIFLASTISILTCCSSSSDKSVTDQLDVPLKKEPAQARQRGSDNNANNSLLLPHGTQINWQQFFKPLPTTSERRAIAKKLLEPLDSNNVEKLVEKARNQIVLGQLRAAEANLREAIRKSPDNINYMLDLVQIYLQRKDHEQAFEYLSFVKSAIDTSEGVSKESVFRYRYALALGYIQRNERSRGHQILSDLIALDKAFSPGYAALASSYLQIGKDKVASFIAKRGLDRGKEDPALLNIIGIVEANNGNLSNARNYFESALKLSPTFAPAIVSLANALLIEGDLEAAELNLIKAADLAPADASIHIALGLCQQRMGRFADARSTFEKALEIQPDNANARFHLGVLAMKNLDETNVALRLFHEVLQVPEATPQLKSMARVYIDDIKENRKGL